MLRLKRAALILTISVAGEQPSYVFNNTIIADEVACYNRQATDLGIKIGKEVVCYEY